MKLYKLTDENDQTHNSCQWGEGVTHSANGDGELCGPGWIHAYTDPLLAVLFNPIHANFTHPHLWEAEGEVKKTNCGLKVGCISLTTLRQIPLPEVTLEQRIHFVILCVREICQIKSWNQWADDWLNNSDRSADKAAWAAAAAWSARADEAAWAAWAAEEAVWEAEETAAWAAARAAEKTAAPTVGVIPLVELARKAIAQECES